MTLRNFSNNANIPTLSGGVTGADTVIPITTPQNWPSVPFFATIDLNGTSPEVVLVTLATPSTFNVARGQGGTAAVPHSFGSTVTHTSVALDFSEANAHTNATTGIHGVTGALAGVTDAQVLTNKTLTTPIINQPTLNASTSAPGAVIKAAASGAQDIAQFTDSAGVALAGVSQIGGFSAKSANIQANNAGTNVLSVSGAAAHTAKLGVFKDSASHELTSIDKDGKVLVNPFVNNATAILTLKNPAAGTTARALEVQDSSGNIVANINGGGSLSATTVFASPGGAPGSNILTLAGVAAQSGRLATYLNSSFQEMAYVDKDGKRGVTPAVDNSTPLLLLKNPAAGITANPLEVQTSAGIVVNRIGPAGDVVTTGLTLNTNGAFNKMATADSKFAVDSNSNLVMAGAKITADSAQANNVPVFSSLTGKKMHFGTATVTTDASGFGNVTHGAGFTPTAVFICWNGQALGGGINPVGADTYGATTFRFRALASTSTSIAYLCFG